MRRTTLQEVRRATNLLCRQWEQGRATFMRAAGPVPGGDGGFTRGTHVHDSWEIIFAVKRRMDVRFPRRRVELQAPGCCFIEPMTPHESSSPADLRRGDQGFVICMEGGKFTCGQVTTSRWDRRYDLSTAQLKVLEDAIGSTVEDLFAGMAGRFERFGPVVPDKVAGRRMMRFISSLAAILAGAKDEERESPLKVVARAEGLMRSRYYDPELTVDAIAQAVRRTPTHLAGLFREHRGRTVRRSLIEIRLAKAMEFLVKGQYSVKEVSCLTGWQNQYYFSNSFFRHFNMRPSKALKRKPGSET